MPTSVLDREEERLAALQQYGLLDGPADDELAAVVRVAAMVAGVPTATLNLIDENRQCQLTTVGFEGSATARDDSMCAVHFRQGRFVHVPDASQHPVYSRNPWVTGQYATVRFYASAPLVNGDGYALGTLCVFDDKVKKLTAEQVSRLLDLADVLVALFERRRQTRQFAELASQRERSRAFTEAILEAIDVGVVVADGEGKLLVFNRVAREWHGHDVTPVPMDKVAAGYNLWDSTGTRLLDASEVPLLRALREGDVHGEEIQIRRPGAAPIDVSCNARQLVGRDGTLLGAVVAMSNVTSDREHRRELEKVQAEMAARGEDLADAVVELRRSNEELEQFAGAVSHDLVRPMAAAHGYLELLSSDYGPTLDPRAGKWLDSASRAVERMQQLVQALLTYARSGQAPFTPSPVDLNTVLSDVLADLRTIAESSRAEVSAGQLPTVQGDPTLLRQLLQNVIDNAMKYRDPDRPCRIAITASRDTGSWIVAVADNGIGIPAGHRDRVFEMFAQLDPTARGGHGIGLSTCLRIVDRHGGSIGIGDTPGGGTTVQIRLPAFDPGQPDKPQRRRSRRRPYSPE